eukprot:m.76871 g.76871  ORF g.76871 m.76871 type:complete len:52 (+) comp11897_c0_seq7:98-253(+)
MHIVRFDIAPKPSLAATLAKSTRLYVFYVCVCWLVCLCMSPSPSRPLSFFL